MINGTVLKSLAIVAVGTCTALGNTGFAEAASITVGAPADPLAGDCAPFGCVIRYQQVYDSSSFSSPFQIDSITFFNQRFPGSIASANYTVSLSTTQKLVNGLSSVFADNIGANQQIFFQGALGGAITGGEFTIAGNGFLYDPSQGNLLLDVIKDAGSSDFSVYLDARLGSAGNSFSRLYSFDSLSSGSLDNSYGLVTRFNGDPAAIPTPALLPGLVGLGLGVLRKRKAEAAETSES